MSRQSDSVGGVIGDGTTYAADVSSTGTLVAFASAADNLSSDDDKRFVNVFVRNRQLGVTTLVSRRSAGQSATPADGGSQNPSISADGRYVAFDSVADNLSTLDDNRFRNVFLRDLKTKTTTLVSRQTGCGDGEAPRAHRSSRAPSISADGHVIAYWSQGRGGSAWSTIEVRNLRACTTRRAGRASGSEEFALSGNGRYVVFVSGGIVVRDLVDGSLRHVTAAPDCARMPAISADGRYVAYRRNVNEAGPTCHKGAASGLFVRDMRTGRVRRVASGSAASPSLSGNGSVLAYVLDGCVAQELQTGVVTRISGPVPAFPDVDPCAVPRVSSDGRFVVFQSGRALNAEDTNRFPDAYIARVGP